MKEAIRNFIVEKARKKFEGKGYNDTTIDEIASAANISKPTLYNYFSGKDEIFRAVVELCNSDIDRLVEQVISEAGSFPEKLKTLVSMLLSHVYENRGILRIVFYESRQFFEAVDEEGNGGLKKWIAAKEERIKLLTDFLREGVREGWIKEQIPPGVISMFLIGIIGEFSLGHLFRKEGMNPVNLESTAGVITQLLVGGIFKDKNEEVFK